MREAERFVKSAPEDWRGTEEGHSERQCRSFGTCRIRVQRLAQLPARHRNMQQYARAAVGTPYWITFEFPAIDMKAASVGILDQIATGLR